MNISMVEGIALTPIGTKVYIPNPTLKSISESEVIGYEAKIGGTPDNLIVYPNYYMLLQANLKRSNLSWKGNEFFTDPNEAQKYAVSFPVTVTDEEFKAVLGMSVEGKRDDLGMEECELSICCSMISNIRDALFTAMKNGSINGVDRETLVELLFLHECPEHMPILTRILKEIGISWTDEQLTVDGNKIQNET